MANFYRQFVADLGITSVVDRRGQRLFAGGDDVFSLAATEVDMGFGVFPELRITHLISAGRLNQQYFLRLIHDHALSHGVLAYMFDGIQPGRIDFVRYVHLLLHAMKNGPFSMRCQWAESRGEDGAAQFISANRLKPLASGQSAYPTEPWKVFSLPAFNMLQLFRFYRAALRAFAERVRSIEITYRSIDKHFWP